jgi:hypothetical protein
MARVTYTGANGESPPLNELEREKLAGQRLANTIAETKLRRLREETLERREVQFVFETTMLVLRRELMRWPSLAVRLPELLRSELTHAQFHAIAMSLDGFIRAELSKVRVSLEKTLASPREVIAELTGEDEPTPEDVDEAIRKKNRANAKRRAVRRKAKP